MSAIGVEQDLETRTSIRFDGCFRRWFVVGSNHLFKEFGEGMDRNPVLRDGGNFVTILARDRREMARNALAGLDYGRLLHEQVQQHLGEQS
jgi:hypothetical protein